jgi:hypothetical protein
LSANRPRILILLCLNLLAVSFAAGQTDPGTGFPQFNTFNRDVIDTINVGNLNIHFQFPVFAKKGKGLDFKVNIIHDNTLYQPQESSIQGVYGWNLNLLATFGWLMSFPTSGQFGLTDHASISPPDPVCYNNSGVQIPYTVLENFSYVDPTNTNILFPGLSVGYPAACYSTQSGTVQNMNGYVLSVAINPTTGAFTTQTVTDPSGNVRNLLTNTLTDPNGNQIANWIDSTGATVISETAVVNSETYYYPSPTGGLNEAVTLTQSNYTLKSNFQCPGTPDLNRGINLTNHISLPDGTSYSIVYESTNGSYPSTTVTGRVHSITLPSGATIAYTYSGGTNGINCMDGSPAIMTKQTPDGTWTYNHYRTTTSGLNGYWTTIVIDPGGNDTVYTFGSLSDIPQGSTFETQRVAYQGSHTSGTILETLVTCYNAVFTNCATPTTSTFAAYPVTQKDVYTYLAGLAQPSLSETFYSPIGQLTKDNEYDFGVNTGAAPTANPIKATILSYASIGSNILNRPACVQITGGSAPTTCGTVTASTKSITNYLNYDSHGNLGEIQKWVSGTTYVRIPDDADQCSGACRSPVPG